MTSSVQDSNKFLKRKIVKNENGKTKRQYTYKNIIKAISPQRHEKIMSDCRELGVQLSDLLEPKLVEIEEYLVREIRNKKKRIAYSEKKHNVDTDTTDFDNEENV